MTKTAAARPAPKFAVGDWAYNNTKGAGFNARVVSVEWDASLWGFQGGWRYAVPGLSTPDLDAERPDKPYQEYVQTSPCSYRKVD